MYRKIDQTKASVAAGRVAKFPVSKFKKFLSYLYIQSRDYGRIKFKLLGGQKYILDEIYNGINNGITTFVILKSRQIGGTTLFVAIDFFWAAKHKGLLGTFILHEEKAIEKWRSTINIFLQSMPLYVDKLRVRPKVLKHNRNLILFGNNSSFSYLTAGTQDNRAGGLGRSQATNYVHGDEVAFYGNEDDIKEFKSSISTIYPHRLQLWISTANGFNHFYDWCQDAKSSKTTKFIFVGWWRDERFQFHVKDRRFKLFCPDNRLSVLERSRVRAVKEQYGFEISLQQVAWYRAKLEEFQNDQSKMDQEFPWTEDDAFQATGSKYFQAPTLTQLYREAKRIGYNGYRYSMTRKWSDISVHPVTQAPNAELKVWEHASRFGYYVVACDPAYGSSDEADNFCIQVWRCFAEGITQVAEFCSRELSYYQCAWIIAHLAGFYGRKDCRVIIEINGAGKAVFRELRELRDDMRMLPANPQNDELKHCLDNMRDYMYNRVDTLSSEFAWQMVMTEDIKRMIMASFKDAVELGRMHIRSVPLIAEMQRLVNNDGSIAADGAGNDDRAVCAAMAFECYRKWLRPMLIGLNMTRAKAYETDERGGDQPIDKLLVNYLKRANIKVTA